MTKGEYIIIMLILLHKVSLLLIDLAVVFVVFLYCYRFSVNKDLYYKMIMITFLVIPRGNEIA